MTEARRAQQELSLAKDKADLQRNSRIGATFSAPFGKRQSLKFSYSTGATTRIGGDFDTFGVAWQMAWLR